MLFVLYNNVLTGIKRLMSICEQYFGYQFLYKKVCYENLSEMVDQNKSKTICVTCSDYIYLNIITEPKNCYTNSSKFMFYSL